MPKPNIHYRRLAGNLELFVGAYFVVFGFLASLYFARLGRHNPVLISVAGSLIGMLLVARAGRLLGWRPWIFWTVALVMILVPIVMLAPPLLTR